jgi:hypothetical protein
VLGVIKPSNILIVVVLPEPFGPTNPQILPMGTSKFACESAIRSPYFLDKSATSSARGEDMRKIISLKMVKTT